MSDVALFIYEHDRLGDPKAEVAPIPVLNQEVHKWFAFYRT